jgi:F-type H+-transporting ATPase subunit gamma
MNAVKTIQKVTKAMKMVAAAKVTAMQRDLASVRKFQQGISSLVNFEKPIREGVSKRALLLLASDRGLCGGVNSAINRRAKNLLVRAEQQKRNYDLLIIGDKARGSMELKFGNLIRWHISEAGRARSLQFKQVAMLADMVNAGKYDEVSVLFNYFKNAIVFETTEEKFYSPALIAKHNTLNLPSKFEVESGGYKNVLENLYEFRTAVRLFHMLQENMTCEQSSRMNAMNNSNKAAGEMLNALSLIYNRNRQAKITTELVEIVSGAAALDG